MVFPPVPAEVITAPELVGEIPSGDAKLFEILATLKVSVPFLTALVRRIVPPEVSNTLRALSLDCDASTNTPSICNPLIVIPGGSSGLIMNAPKDPTEVTVFAKA